MSVSDADEDEAPDSVTIRHHSPDDDERVVVLACHPDAYAEAAVAVESGKTTHGGRRIAIFPVDAPRGLLHHIVSPGPGLMVFIVSAAQLASTARAWMRMCYPADDDRPPARITYLDAIPDEVLVTHVTCRPGWNRFDIEVGHDTEGIEVRISGEVVGPTYSAMRGPATWENSDPVGLLLRELDVDRDGIITLPERVFTISTFVIPVVGAFALLTLVDFSVAVTVFGVLLGFAIAPSWDRYARAVVAHREEAREQGQDPTIWLVKRVTFSTLGIAVRRDRTPRESFKSVEYSGHLRTSVGSEASDVRMRVRRTVVRRPRFFWDRFIARRRATWWGRRVQPVHGTYPPERYVKVSRNRLIRPIDRVWCRWVLWRVRRTLVRHATSITEALHTLDRFWEGSYWHSERRSQFPGFHMTAQAAAGLLFGFATTTEWPATRTAPPIEVPISLRRPEEPSAG